MAARRAAGAGGAGMDVSLAQKAKGGVVPGATGKPAGKPTTGGGSSWLPRGATTPTRQNVPGATPPGNAAAPGTTMTSDQAAAEVKSKGAASAASQWLPRGVTLGNKKPPAK